MLEEILRYLHNWFCGPEDIRPGRYSIDGGYLYLPFAQEGQYFRIIGSASNDGVYQNPVESLIDEEFQGAIWLLRVPASLLALVEEIEEWQNNFGSTAAGPYQSESFGGYSYTKASGASSWTDVFDSRLTGWRKL